MIAAVIFGTQQIVIESPSFFLSYLPSITILDAPYIWRDIDHIYSVNLNHRTHRVYTLRTLWF